MDSSSSSRRGHRELTQIYGQEFAKSIASKEYTPWVSPYRTVGIFLVIGYFLIPPTKSRLVFYARYPLFAFLVYWSWLAAIECRSGEFSVGYGLGLINAWAVLWTSALLIFNDARGDFARVERKTRSSRNAGLNSKKVGADATHSNGSLRLRARRSDGHTGHSKRSTGREASTPDDESKQDFFWQTLPEDFSSRLDWALDLVVSFRGPGWSFQISTIPNPPPEIISSLDRDPPRTSSMTTTTYQDSASLTRSTLIHLAAGYLALDVLKVFMMADPYFLGDLDAPPPPHIPHFIAVYPSVTSFYRLVTSLLAVYASLQTILGLGPLFHILLGPKYLGLRGEPWQYPACFGDYSLVFTKGLTGWWGGWWHGIFRFAFEAPSKWAIAKLGWNPRSAKAKTLATVVAFACSGFLHFWGSWTTWPSTQPWKPFLFFLLQPLGIAAQMAGSMLLQRAGILQHLPRWLRGLANFISTHLFFCLVGPLFTDDLARGGVWLFDPIPISVVRGLGFGAEGEGWLCRHENPAHWWKGERWWQSGFAV